MRPPPADSLRWRVRWLWSKTLSTERFHTIVIGGGQAGLSVGYYLARAGRPFVILDASERVGDAWRQRWDSLRLFTPAMFDGLVGMTFPAPPFSFPTKNEMADYLEAYARRFQLPVRNGIRVDRLTRVGGRYLVEAGVSPVRSRPRGRRDVELPGSTRTRVRERSARRHSAVALERVSQSAAAEARRRATRRCRQLGRRDRDRIGDASVPPGCPAATPDTCRSGSTGWPLASS